ncbi:glycine/D-amino acid oxidase-like deaminating enzyme [Novosphingobium chloroacetimidivorans]|uniref:Glycine/D-amino acid oxidase-like deaminating enzyme n=1 Tax=Novosphingobium chloroacetimidivorans TaxID=1428314 RepID=A0A7W7K8F0_9SPHN|nr:FAD-dependent oxidoreductase [Novosphingobium chloroacetimidivorans]MBB4858145.1 glycine/D-amino acid oxidase-like deaminating enzyme [Novosphingobium chloroacetimidivorans]
MTHEADYLIVGGGFYGCALALFLRSLGKRIVLVEAGDELLGRASRVNQARVHTGFHYPRSALTAVKSMVLHRRFATDFPDAVVDDFQMLYAIARHRSKVSALRFQRMFAEMGAPIARATPSQAALFAPDTIEEAFACDEFAFDWSVLARHMGNRLDALGIEVRLGMRAQGLETRPGGAVVRLSDGSQVAARFVFNVTYAQTNALLASADLPQAALKHEQTEIALVEVPSELAPYGLTVMDGPFFSCMPYPSAGLHSLTHVRYTPHAHWTDGSARREAYEVFDGLPRETRQRHMVLDAARYVPALAHARYERSLFEVKTVLAKNERDDGRPILFQRQPEGSPVISIMGGKIDNIYDLFDILRQAGPEWAAADDRFVHGRAMSAA